MATIWKYNIGLGSERVIAIPAGGKLLHFDSQFGDFLQLQIWVQVDPAAATEYRRFLVIGTGHSVPFNGTYCGSVVVAQGKFVWHLYELPKIGASA